MSKGQLYCEMCGAPLDPATAKRAVVEGVQLTLCPSCYAKVVKPRQVGTSYPAPQQPRVGYRQQIQAQSRPQLQPRVAAQPSQRPRVSDYMKYELVEDYAERIRRARERLGWSQKVLAEKVKESELTIKRIESGRLRPTIELARKLEEVLGIKLLEPAVDHYISSQPRSREDTYLTLGEVARLRRSEEG